VEIAFNNSCPSILFVVDFTKLVQSCDRYIIICFINLSLVLEWFIFRFVFKKILTHSLKLVMLG
jgi:hypothetical protein